MTDFLFRGDLTKLDPDVFALTQLEAERQARKLILILARVLRRWLRVRRWLRLSRISMRKATLTKSRVG